MGIFDKIKGNVTDVAKRAAASVGNQKETIVIRKLPESLDELKALPEAAMDTPFKTAALTLCALCAYGAEAQIGIEMLNFLRGPRPLSTADLSFLKDRFMDNHYYIPFSYFEGATPDNDYRPSEPFTVTIEAGPYAYNEEGYAKLDIRSGGADSPRQITLRKPESSNVWYLWDQAVMVGIREPKSMNPWA